MNSRMSLAILAAAFSGLTVSSAQAGPCNPALAQFEQAVCQSARNPNAGPVSPQIIGAQPGQPTPASIRRARARAWSVFRAQLARAKRLDVRGNSGCTAALARADDMYNLH